MCNSSLYVQSHKQTLLALKFGIYFTHIMSIQSYERTVLTDLGSMIGRPADRYTKGLGQQPVSGFASYIASQQHLTGSMDRMKEWGS